MHSPAEFPHGQAHLADFDVSEDLVQSREHDEAATGMLSFDGLLPQPLSIHQDVQNGNGGRTWIAGTTLAKYLIRMRRDELRGLSIVDLGSGNGIVGLAIGVGCAPAIVHITDQQPMLALMLKNIELNGLQGKVQASVYDWGNARPEHIPESPDVVLAADCVYFEPAFPLLQKTLHDLIGPTTVCFFCFKKRRRADMSFLKAIRKQFWVEDIADDPDRDSYARENVFLLTIRQKPETKRS